MDLDNDFINIIGAKGKEIVFESVFKDYRERILNLCQRLTGNRTDAEDAFQETMVGVYSGLETFEGRSKLGTWIHRIAIRASLRIRSLKKTPFVDLPENLSASPNLSGIEAREELQKVVKAINELPVESRLILHLFALQDLSHAQIAEILGAPEGTVWSRLHRARTLLRKKLESDRSI